MALFDDIPPEDRTFGKGTAPGWGTELDAAPDWAWTTVPARKRQARLILGDTGQRSVSRPPCRY